MMLKFSSGLNCSQLKKHPKRVCERVCYVKVVNVWTDRYGQTCIDPDESRSLVLAILLASFYSITPCGTPLGLRVFTVKYEISNILEGLRHSSHNARWGSNSCML